MPALDTTFGLPAAATATPADAYAATADNSADHSSSGNEFSRMMDRALAPAADKKTSARADTSVATPATPTATGRPKSSAIRGQAKAAASSSAAVAPRDADSASPTTPASLAGDSSTDKTAESSATITPDAAKTDEAVPVAPALVEPLPVFQPLPFAAYFRSAAGMGGSANASAGLMAFAINPLTSAAVSAGSNTPAGASPVSGALLTPVNSSTAGASANVTAPVASVPQSPSALAAAVVTDGESSPETAALLKTLAPSLPIPASPAPETGQPVLPATAVAEPWPTSGWSAPQIQTAAGVSALPSDPATAGLAVKPANQAGTPASDPSGVQVTSPASLASSVQVTLSNSAAPASQAGSPTPVTANAPASLPGLADVSAAFVSPERAAMAAGSTSETVAAMGLRPAGLPDQPVATASVILPAAPADPASSTPTISPSPSVAPDNEPTVPTTLAGAAVAMQKALFGKEKSVTPGKTNATNDAGTGVAFNDSAMKKNENTNKVAGLDVKVLPGSATDLAREKNLPPHLVVAPVNTPENRPNDLSGVSPLTGAPAAETSATVTVVDLPSLSDARMRALERTHDMVSLHALRLMESRSDTLQVTIKPAVGTELSLELRHRNGAIEAQATVERGDFQYLNQHWPELQQKLEQRGIRLSPLGGESNLLSGDGSSQHDARQQAAQEEAAMQASAFAEFASVGNWGGATARLAVDYDGWESWA